MCAGIAKYLGVPPLWMRIAWLVSLLLLGPIPVVIYLAAVILLPSDGELASPPTVLSGDVGGGLVLLGVMLMRKEVRIERSDLLLWALLPGEHKGEDDICGRPLPQARPEVLALPKANSAKRSKNPKRAKGHPSSLP